jgi:hypothetical protein
VSGGAVREHGRYTTIETTNVIEMQKLVRTVCVRARPEHTCGEELRVWESLR